MNNKLFFQMEVKEVKQEDAGGAVRIEGFASTPDIDRYRDIVEPKAFASAIEMYMKNPVILYQHDGDRPVGNATSVKVTEKGFWISASIVDEDTKTKILDGRMRAFSIGYMALESALQHEDGTAFNAETDSIWDPKLVRVIKKLDLVEISIVSTPANGNALFTIAKSVKKYFRELGVKAFTMQTKNVPENEVDAEVQKPVEEVEKPVEEEKEETPAPTETAAPEAQAEPAAQEEEAKDAPAAEGTSNEPTNGQKPQEEDEKGDENAPADSAEGQQAEEAKAESEPVAEADGEESFTVSSSVAKALPALVQAGVLVEAKEAGKGLDLPKEIVQVMKSLCDTVTTLATEKSELEAKLNAIPQKSALSVMSQYEQPKSAEAKTEAKSNGQASEGFLSLFNQS